MNSMCKALQWRQVDNLQQMDELHRHSQTQTNAKSERTHKEDQGTSTHQRCMDNIQEASKIVATKVAAWQI